MRFIYSTILAVILIQSSLYAAEMAYVTGGTFTMGTTSGDEDESPQHTVSLDGFYIDTFEVTNADFSKFISAVNKEDAKFIHDERFNKPVYPVVGVAWGDALEYCRWRGKRLPTEAEWEKAARGEDARIYPWGMEFHPDRLNISGDDLFPFTAPVGSFPKGISPYGIMDMLGNVWEWCLDWYDKGYYKSLKGGEINPNGPASGSLKVLRGGSWFNEQKIIRVTKRYKSDPYNKSQTYGFRCVKEGTDKYL